MENKIRRIMTKAITLFVLALVMAMIIPAESQAAKLSRKSVTLLKGTTYTLRLNGTKSKGKWKTSKKAVVKLTRKKKSSVKIKATKVGKVVVSANVKGKTYKCKITVVDPRLSQNNLVLTEGQTGTLKVTGGAGKVKWKSDNVAIASVSNNGNVVGKKAGRVKITAKINGRTMNCLVTVKSKATSSETEATESKKWVEKKVWVVTERAWTEQKAIYINRRSEWECSCGYKTEDSDEFTVHEKWHLNNLVDYAYRVNELKDFSHYEVIEHPEKGYWKTEWIYE